ncbi:MAG: zinc metallopeptidase [Verrucomicrobiales bacterium]|nr:zinc metallopeptidase [Verrucomicrobiales bacterium]
MKWEGRRRSDNIEDRRGAGGPRMAMGGGLGLVVILVLVALLGGDPMALLEQMDGGSGGLPGIEQSGGPVDPAQDELAAFVGVVLADTEDVWHHLFQEMGDRYEEPKLVLFSGQVRSACGFASAASGPFYCPADRNVYIDLVFYKELKQRFGAPGDFAQAYVIAHEVGHHVQNLMGISEKVQSMRGRVSEAEYNQLSVRLELQADFFAGVWAHHAERMKGILESGDVEEALRAANAIGDDTLQRQSQGHVVPDSFTHGTSDQRMRWFLKGFQTGDLSQGDTFAAREL